MKELMSQGLILIYDDSVSEENRTRAAQELSDHITANKGVVYRLSSANSAKLGLLSDLKPYAKSTAISNNGYQHFYEDTPAPFQKGVAYIGTVRAKRASNAYEVYSQTNLPRPIYGSGETGPIFILPSDTQEKDKYAWIDDTVPTKSELINALHIQPSEWGLRPHVSRDVTHAMYQLIDDIYKLNVFPTADETLIQSLEHVISEDTTHSSEILEIIKTIVLPKLV